MTHDLEARRARAINRATTRAVQHPHGGGFALIEWMRTAPPETFDTAQADIRVVRGRGDIDYWVDGAMDTGLRDAVALIQDRYGVTQAEAEELIAAAEPVPGPRRLGSV